MTGSAVENRELVERGVEVDFVLRHQELAKMVRELLLQQLKPDSWEAVDIR